MREILFRGKRTCNNEWVEGGFHSRFGKAYIIGISKTERIDGTEVIPETVGQYTGLTDKNGKKIFEGDIVKLVALSNDHNQKGAITIAIIENHVGNTCLNISGHQTGTTLYPIIVDHTVEVIGNIHDNPELLKGEWYGIFQQG